MLRLAFDFIITWRETRTRPNAYLHSSIFPLVYSIVINCHLPSNLPLMGALSQLLIPSIKSMNNNICFIC